MDYKLMIAAWILFAASVIYWDLNRWEWKNPEPLSKCHNAPIRVYHDRAMCTECKLFCETIDG